LQHIAKNKKVWLTSPGKICDYVSVDPKPGVAKKLHPR
jgi:hypothetical protein